MATYSTVNNKFIFIFSGLMIAAVICWYAYRAIDRGMLDSAIEALSAQRLLWACDLTMETGLAKLRALDVIHASEYLSDADLADIRWRNAARIFPRGAFPRCEAAA